MSQYLIYLACAAGVLTPVGLFCWFIYSCKVVVDSLVIDNDDHWNNRPAGLSGVAGRGYGLVLGWKQGVSMKVKTSELIGADLKLRGDYAKNRKA